jgi:hydrogenase maturation factor HypF (carbamoyltransferase family)
MELIMSPTKTIKTMRYCRKCKRYYNYLLNNRYFRFIKLCPRCYIKEKGLKQYLLGLEETQEATLYNQDTMLMLLRIAKEESK